MTENEAIDFLEDEINGLKEQRDGALGEIAEKVFYEINRKERIATFRMIIGFIIELKQYREIGTVEECREGVEKQNQKPLDFYGDSEDGKLLCPNCGNDLWELKECGFNNCPYCGQAIDENLEGMEDE